MVNTRSQKRRRMPKRATRKNRNAQTKRRGQQKGGEGGEPPANINFESRFNELKTKPNCGQNLNFEASKANPNKNRYNNILATEETRVKLSGENDYINANYITLSGPKQNGGSGLKNLFKKKGKYQLTEPLTIKVNDGKPVEVPLTDETIMIDSDKKLMLIVPGIGEKGSVNLGNYEEFKKKIGEEKINVMIDGLQKTITFNKPPTELIPFITQEEQNKGLGNFEKLRQPQEKPKIVYIATQGPISSTINDFWKMVVKNDVNCIVMVTKLVEMRKIKCADYFNSTGKENYFTYKDKDTHKDITFTLTKEEDNAVYEERTFTYDKDGETKTVTHLWFRKWPDHGAPNEGDFMILLQRFNELKKASPGTFKPLVHCSAGVGRTGTFIVLDHILYDKQGNPKTDLDLIKYNKFDLINDTICQLRQQRNSSMVQSIPQYEFIYNFIKNQSENHGRFRANSGIGSNSRISSNFSNSSREEEEPLPPDPVITSPPVEITMKNKGFSSNPDDLAKDILLLFKDKRIKIFYKDNLKRAKLSKKGELLKKTNKVNEYADFITYKELENKLIEILNKLEKYNRGNEGVNLTIDPNNLIVKFHEKVDDVYSMLDSSIHLSKVVKDALKILAPPNSQTGGRKSKSKSKTKTQKRRSTNSKKRRTRKSKK